MLEIDLQLPKGAIFSADRKYRYALWRVWNPNKSLLLGIGLNPSKADSIIDDPTITRLMRRSGYLGFGGFLMANLYAYVSTVPRVLLEDGDHVGELTDYYLQKLITLSERQLCCWGSFKPVINRAPQVYKMLSNPYCLSINSDGQPKHPLYVGYDTEMVPYKFTVESQEK